MHVSIYNIRDLMTPLSTDIGHSLVAKADIKYQPPICKTNLFLLRIEFLTMAEVHWLNCNRTLWIYWLFYTTHFGFFPFVSYSGSMSYFCKRKQYDRKMQGFIKKHVWLNACCLFFFYWEKLSTRAWLAKFSPTSAFKK